MISIRGQLIVSFLASLILTTLIFVVAYQLMFVTGTSMLYLTLATVLSSSLALLMSNVFISPLIKKIKQLNAQTTAIANGDLTQNVTTIGSPKELNELSASISAMTGSIIGQLAQIQGEQQQKDELLQNLTHDLKTPLASIVSHAQGLQDGVLQSDAQQRAAYEVLVAQSLRLSQLFDALSDVTRLQDVTQQEAELIYLDRLLVNLLASYQQRLETEKRQVAVDFEQEVPPFWQYRLPLERILLNLIDNALKYSPDGTPLKITVATAQNQLVVTVIDQGIGIASEQIPRIFERTYRVEQSRNQQTGGAGLGLSIAQNMAQQIGASITVTSEIGVGTSVSVTLPMSLETNKK